MKRFFILALLLASTAFAREDTCLTILKSNASTQDKAAACRELTRVGTGQAVPVLASLLTDETLSHMARYALEPIPDPAVDTALRHALGQLDGPLLAGVIDSLGVRKDIRAVQPLCGYLIHTNPVVVQAAARALGSIGLPAVPVLKNALSNGAQTHRRALCEGLFRSAETLSDAEAIDIYDTIRSAPDLPHQVQVAALRGAILRRGTRSMTLCIETIRDESSALQVDAVGMSMHIPGRGMTKAIAGALSNVNEPTRHLLVQTLGNRGDATATRALVPLARTGPASLRVAAIRSLVQLGSPSSIPVLIAMAEDADQSVSIAAQAGLIGFPTPHADAAVVAWLNESDARHRMAAIDVASQRRIPGAVPALLKATGDANAKVVTASFKTLGELASVAQIPDVVNAMLTTQAVPAAEAALSTICARQTDKTPCTERLLPGLARAKGNRKLALLRVLRTVGDAQALAAIRAAATESDRAVRETAVRVLCDWPNANALPDLVQVVKTTPNATFKILALRGQLRLIPTQTESDAIKLSQLKAMLPMIERTEEKRLVLATLGQLPSAESLALVMAYLTQGALKDEASVTAVGMAEHIATTHPIQVAEALKRIKTKNDKLAERVRKLLASTHNAMEDGFISIFNGKDLTGWDGKPGWWRVEDGALTAESTPARPCKACNYLVWRNGQPADFELVADFKVSAQGNSGIQIRSEIRPAWDTYGYQADMTGDGELIGFVYHHKYALIAGRGTEAVFQADGKSAVEQANNPAELLKHFKPDDWNTYRIICQGPAITLYINDVLMCQITDHRVAKEARHGVIALQMHPGPPMKIQFKNIRLKAL